MKRLIMIVAVAFFLASCGSGTTSTSTESTSSDSSSSKTITPTQNGGGVTGDGAAPVTMDSTKKNQTIVTPANADSAGSVKSHSTETHKMTSTDKKKNGKM